MNIFKVTRLPSDCLSVKEFANLKALKSQNYVGIITNKTSSVMIIIIYFLVNKK